MCSIMGYCDQAVQVDVFKTGFEKTVSRGPNKTAVVHTGGGALGFHRLATFAIGMDVDAIDLKCIREAEYFHI